MQCAVCAVCGVLVIYEERTLAPITTFNTIGTI